MLKKTLFTIVGLFLLIGTIAGVKAMQIVTLISAMSTMVPPPETVASVKVQEIEWEATLNAVGSLESARGVTITADLPGRVDSIQFIAGAEIGQGDVILQQDISSENAQLRVSQASASLAESNLKRMSELWEKRVVSKAQYDSALAEFDAARAQVDNVEISIRKKTIVAPFAGKLGIRQVNIGQDINEGQAIVTLQASDLIYVNFMLPQQYLSQLRNGLDVRVSSDTVPGKTFNGKITAISPEVDVNTRSVKIQATMENKDRSLLPGVFTTVDIVLDESQSVAIIPITAVRFATFGDSVFVIEKKKDEQSGKEQTIARQQFVRLGETRGDYVVVELGVEEGQIVASAGVHKLRNGAPVSLNNDIQPEYELNPSPEDS